MFKIDKTDFGIDLKKSKFKVSSNKKGETFFNVEIYGDKAQTETLAEDEDGPWSWILYPPHFYARSVALTPANSPGTFRAKITVDDIEEDELEAAIYLVEHNDVDETVITASDNSLQVKGTVFLSGKPRKFEIRMTKG